MVIGFRTKAYISTIFRLYVYWHVDGVICGLIRSLRCQKKVQHGHYKHGWPKPLVSALIVNEIFQDPPRNKHEHISPVLVLNIAAYNMIINRTENDRIFTQLV